MIEEIYQPFIVRADTSAQIGTGHLMRCLALGEVWQATGIVKPSLFQCVPTHFVAL
jgi:hypothetical protein